MSNLAIELHRLRANIIATERALDDIHIAWSESGGVCCTSCFSRGKSDELESKNYRRQERIRQIELKMAKDRSQIIFK